MIGLFLFIHSIQAAYLHMPFAAAFLA